MTGLRATEGGAAAQDGKVLVRRLLGPHRALQWQRRLWPAVHRHQGARRLDAGRAQALDRERDLGRGRGGVGA